MQQRKIWETDSSLEIFRFLPLMTAFERYLRRPARSNLLRSFPTGIRVAAKALASSRCLLIRKPPMPLRNSMESILRDGHSRSMKHALWRRVNMMAVVKEAAVIAEVVETAATIGRLSPGPGEKRTGLRAFIPARLHGRGRRIPIRLLCQSF